MIDLSIAFFSKNMVRVEDIIEKVTNNHPQSDVDLIRRAYLFSALHHRGQKRASGEPYLVHPLAVANILAEMRLDEVSISTGLLHDVVEDTLVDLDTLRSYFGDEITYLVDGLTKIAQISDLSKEQQQAENVRKMVLAMITDVRVVLIKLADRLAQYADNGVSQARKASQNFSGNAGYLRTDCSPFGDG